MSTLRKPTKEEAEEIYDLLPYGFRPYIKKIEMVDHPKEVVRRYEDYVKRTDGEDYLLFHGSRKTKEILNDGYLDPKYTPRGNFSDGNGVYLAEDIDLSIPFGRSKAESKVFIVKTFIKPTVVQNTIGGHKRYNKEKISTNAIKTQSYFYNDCVNEEIVVFDKDAMLLKALLTVIAH